MSNKQELKDLVGSYTKAKKEAQETVNKIAEDVQQSRQESGGQSNRSE